MSQPKLRPYRDDDKSFIIQSWMRSYWDGAISYLLPIKPSIYNKAQHELITELFTRPEIAVIVAAHPEEDDVIVGWIMLELDKPQVLVHYIYVKEVFRRLGIASLLMASVNIHPSSIICSHLTKRARKIMCKYPDFTFNPWLLAR